MGYKNMKQNLGFAYFALASSMKHNRSIKNMEKLDKAIDWSRVDAILMSHYTVGTSGEGANAYSPCCCSNACCCKNGFTSIPTRNWKTKLMTTGLLKNLNLSTNLRLV